MVLEGWYTPAYDVCTSKRRPSSVLIKYQPAWQSLVTPIRRPARAVVAVTNAGNCGKAVLAKARCSLQTRCKAGEQSISGQWCCTALLVCLMDKCHINNPNHERARLAYWFISGGSPLAMGLDRSVVGQGGWLASLALPTKALSRPLSGAANGNAPCSLVSLVVA